MDLGGSSRNHKDAKKSGYFFDVRDVADEGGKKVDIFGTYTLPPENFRNTSVVGGHKAIPGKTPYILEFRKCRLSREIFSQKGVQ